jgi:hypothetical protein
MSTQFLTLTPARAGMISFLPQRAANKPAHVSRAAVIHAIGPRSICLLFIAVFVVFAWLVAPVVTHAIDLKKATSMDPAIDSFAADQPPI